MLNLEKLRLLEDRVEWVLDQHAAVCRERDRLHEQLGETESRLQRMVLRIEQYEKERVELKARVERILSRLDGLDLG